jgi:hypothetical protein
MSHESGHNLHAQQLASAWPHVLLLPVCLLPRPLLLLLLLPCCCQARSLRPR